MGKIRSEGGIVIGTSGDKYKTKNPISRLLIKGFDNAISELVSQVHVNRILEIGSGEGHVTEILIQQISATTNIVATDISETVLSETKKTIQDSRVTFQSGSLETLVPEQKPELVVCCEVLEHLTNPEIGLEALSRFDAEYYLLSVPREPIWRVLNMSRGAYLRDWGNSPGHLQHWSKREFIRFVEKKFDILVLRTPLPWIVLLCAKR